MKTLLFTLTLSMFLSGCTGYTFEPENSAPKNEYEAVVKAQQGALTQQQEAILNE